MDANVWPQVSVSDHLEIWCENIFESSYCSVRCSFFPLFISTLKLINWFPLLLEGSLFVCFFWGFFSVPYSLVLIIPLLSLHLFMPFWNLCDSRQLHMPPVTGVSVSYKHSIYLYISLKAGRNTPTFIWTLSTAAVWNAACACSYIWPPIVFSQVKTQPEVCVHWSGLTLSSVLRFQSSLNWLGRIRSLQQ